MVFSTRLHAMNWHARACLMDDTEYKRDNVWLIVLCDCFQYLHRLIWIQCAAGAFKLTNFKVAPPIETGLYCAALTSNREILPINGRMCPNNMCTLTENHMACLTLSLSMTNNALSFNWRNTNPPDACTIFSNYVTCCGIGLSGDDEFYWISDGRPLLLRSGKNLGGGKFHDREKYGLIKSSNQWPQERNITLYVAWLKNALMIFKYSVIHWNTIVKHHFPWTQTESMCSTPESHLWISVVTRYTCQFKNEI